MMTLIEQLRAQNEDGSLVEITEAEQSEAADLLESQATRIAELEAELERERVRLAACGSAALGYFEGCKDEYRSASLDDVLRLRDELAALRKRIDEQEKAEPVGYIDENLNLRMGKPRTPGPLYAHPVPAGMVLVPVEPTVEMINAGEEAVFQSRRRDVEFKAKTGEVPNISSAPNMAYKAMLAAVEYKHE